MRAALEAHRLGLFVAGHVVAGGALFAIALASLDADWGSPWLIAAVMTAEALAQARPISVPIGREVHDFEFDEAVLVAAAFLLPGRGLLIVVLGGVVINNLVRRRVLIKQAFNLGAHMAGASLGVMVMQALAELPPDRPHIAAPLAAIAGAVVLAVYMEVSVGSVIAVAERRSLRAVVSGDSLVSTWGSLFGATIGALMGIAGSWSPLAILLGLPPALLSGALLRRFSESVAQQRRLDGLLRTAIEANSVLGRGEVEVSLTESARHLLRSGDARIGVGPGEGEIGALVLADPETWLVAGGRSARSPFDAEDRRMLEGIAAIGAAALKNAMLLERMREQATHDALTGLANLVLFEDRVRHGIQTARRSQESLAIAFLDLDRFKRVNDVLGHPAGDEVLRQVGARLQEVVRGVDTVCRVGGDEFTFLLPGVLDRGAARQVLERAVAALREPVVVGDIELRLTASVGFAMFPEDGDDFDTLVRRADIAMYRGKERGRDVIQGYLDDFDHYRAGSLALESELHRALEQGEIWVAFQPQLDVRTGAVVGAEALVRWTHPIFGNIPPDRFLPLAEDSGLVAAIDWFVLETSLGQLAEWTSVGIDPLRISVNFSAKALHDAHAATRILEALAAAGVAANRLEVELTEQVVALRGDSVQDVLDRLRRSGVRVAIDDFGTGYSSLARLREFPVDVLKIDKTFTHDIEKGDTAIVVSTIEMAHRLGCEVVAEGVETEEQFEFLRSHGCDLVQGYLTGRPSPPAELEQRLRVRAAV